MLNNVKNLLTKMNSLSPPKKLLLLLIVSLIVVVVLAALDIIPRDTVFPVSSSQGLGSVSGAVPPPIPEHPHKPIPEHPHKPIPEPLPEPLVYIASGGCVGGKQEIPEGHCDANPKCTAIGRQHNGCWHQLKGDVPDQAQRDKYKWGLFKKTASGYEPIQ